MKKRKKIKRRNAVQTVREVDLRKMKNDAVNEALMLLTAIPIKVLHDQYGWGAQKRLPEFAEAMMKEYQDFATGKMTLNQYKRYVYKMCGLRVEFRPG